MRSVVRKNFKILRKPSTTLTNSSANKTFQVFPVDLRGHKEVIFSDTSHYYLKCPLVSTTSQNEELFSKMSHLLEKSKEVHFYCRNSLRSLALLLEAKKDFNSNNLNRLEYLISVIINEYPNVITKSGLGPQIIRQFLDVIAKVNPKGEKMNDWLGVLFFENKLKCGVENFGDTFSQSTLTTIMKNFVQNPAQIYVNNVHLADILERYNDITTLRGTTFIANMVDMCFQRGAYFRPELIEMLYRNLLDYKLKSCQSLGIRYSIPHYILKHIDFQLDGINYVLDRLKLSMNTNEDDSKDGTFSRELFQPATNHYKNLARKMLSLKFEYLSKRYDNFYSKDLKQLISLMPRQNLKFISTGGLSFTDYMERNKNCVVCGAEWSLNINTVENLKRFSVVIDRFVATAENFMRKFDFNLPEAATKSAQLDPLLSNPNYHYIIDFNNYMLTNQSNSNQDINWKQLIDQFFHEFENSSSFVSKNILLVCQMSKYRPKHSNNSFLTYRDVVERAHRTKFVHSINVDGYSDDFVCLYVAMKQMQTILRTNNHTLPLPTIKSNDIYKQYASLVDLDLRNHFDTLLDVVVSPMCETASRSTSPNSSNVSQTKILRPLSSAASSSGNSSTCSHIVTSKAIYCVNFNSN